MGNKKRMYKKGSFLEPNKELTFGGKGKYQAAGPRGRSTNEEGARAGTPRAEAAARAKANNSSNMKRVLPPSSDSRTSTALSVLDQSEFRSGKGAAASSNKASSIAKVAGAKSAKAEPKVGDKLRELEKAPSAKPGPKPGTYAYAKKRNPNLDKLIAERKKYAKGTEDYNRVQNQINRAYGKGPMRKEISKVAAAKTPKNTAKPTIQKPASAKPAASKPAPKPAAKKSTPKQTPSGGSGMGAVAKENEIKKELQSAKPVDRRASATKSTSNTKPTSKRMDRLVKKVKKEDARLRRKNTSTTPEGRRPRAQARRLNRAANASDGVKKMGDNYGGNATKAAKMDKMGDALEKDLRSRGMMMGGMKYGKGGFPDLNGDGKVTFADVLKGRLKGKKRNRK